MREQVKALAISSPILVALAISSPILVALAQVYSPLQAVVALAQVYSPLQAVVAQLFQLRVEARLISALGVVLV